MFNIGSFEVLLILIIALLVLGPERLPGAIKTTGLWVGRFRRSFYKVKAEIERELNADEIRRQLHNESVLAEIEDAKSKVEDFAKDTEKSIKNLVNSKDFDPGAAKASLKESTDIANDAGKSIKEELQEAGDQVAEVTREIYATGKNPKLAQSANPKNDKQDESKQENDVS